MATLDVWTCCQCRNSNLDANAPDRCPTCSHFKCQQCTNGRCGLAEELAFPSTTPADIFVPRHLHTSSFAPDNTYPFDGAASDSGMLAHVEGYHGISQYTYLTGTAAGIEFAKANPADDEHCAYYHDNDDRGEPTYF